jgi:hypothetical protein
MTSPVVALAEHAKHKQKFHSGVFLVGRWRSVRELVAARQYFSMLDDIVAPEALTGRVLGCSFHDRENYNRAQEMPKNMSEMRDVPLSTLQAIAPSLIR